MELFVRFDPGLEFFLPESLKGGGFTHQLNRRASVKDIIESFGIPHTEVGSIRLGGKRVGFGAVPDSDGSLEVCSPEEPFRVTAPSFLRPEPLRKIRFVADVNVIRLGRLMILAGFDVSYSSRYSDREIADISGDEKRIVLTRDTALLKQKKIVYARRVRSNLPYDQLAEVVRFFGLTPQAAFFSRCSTCNRPLEKVEKKKVMHLLEPKTRKYYDLFFQCPCCGQVFWRGSHYEKIRGSFQSLGIRVHGRTDYDD